MDAKGWRVMASVKKSSQRKTKNLEVVRRPEPEGGDVKKALFPVVGFGASAGGLEAFTELLQHVPAEPGFALVLVQHLDPKHSSILTELLSRATHMPVAQVRDGMPVEQNRVYVIPPNTNLSIRGGFLRLEPRPPMGQHMPIDHFFRSLAQERGNRAIGVILSGTASDGTLGVKAIKAEGGITFAQNPNSARYDGMPRSAISTGCVDAVLSPEEIARELVALTQHPYVNGGAEPAPEPTDDEATAFHEIFSMLRSATGVDFGQYKPGTIQRRTLRRMALHKLEKVRQYVNLIRENRSEVQQLFQDILINVTSFFREPETFTAIKARLLPSIFGHRTPADPVRVWVPGCATGEEVYSIAIALLEYMREAEIEIPLQIFGTDVSEAALERARSGVYPESIAADVSADRLRRFFVRSNGTFQIARTVRDACVFARQNVTKDPPFSRLDLVLCRNVLIYLGPGLQMAVMRLFHYALRPGGYLVLGNSETVGNAADLFGPIDKQLKIYSKKATATAVLTSDLGAYHEPHAGAAAPKIPEPAPVVDTQKRVDQLLLARFSPPALVVDRSLRILQFRGQTTPYIEHVSGEASLDLIRMTPSGLGLEVRNLLRRAEQKNAPVRSNPTTLALKDRMHTLRISVTPIQSAGPAEPQFLVVLEEVPEAEKPRKQARGRGTTEASSEVRVRGMEQELATTREYLQTVIEEQEAATEELKSAHEEVQSANEELQSTNEELLTAKEELQSTNEELTTVNEEMQSRNAELQQVNNDLINLLSSVNIPIVMLGSDLRIRRFTPQAERLYSILPTDIGRPISDFRLKINVPDLATVCQEVLDSLAAREREVQDAEGRTYSMWVRPYRTAENRIEGVVIAMLDVTERKQAAEARYRRLFEASSDGILIADAQTGAIVDANPYITRLFGYERSQLVGQPFWETPLFQGSGMGQVLLDQLREGGAMQRSTALPSTSGERIPTDIVCNLYAEGERHVIQFNIRDVTARKRLEDQVRLEDDQLRQAQKMEAVGRLAGGVAHDFNNLLTAIVGYCDLLADEKGGAQAAGEIVEQIRGAADRAAILTKQLLAFGRRQVIHPTVLDPGEVVSDMRQLLGVMLPRDIELKIEQGTAEGRVRADRSQLEQVVLNLVLNARDAMPNGGEITVQTGDVDVGREFSSQHPVVPAGEYVSLTVKDTGTGMDSETQAHIFEPFFTTKTKDKGAGLGLATTYGIVQQCGGYIWAYSELGVGTTFTVFLPRVAAEPARQREPEIAAAAGGSETVLLVEDEPAVQELARRFLEQRGYRVMAASSGPEALRIAREHKGPIDLLLTDVVMPQMSGREVAFQLAGSWPNMKVLYMSGHTEDVIVHHGVLEDRVAFLQKPFTQRVLVAKVREVLDRAATSTAEGTNQ